MPITGIEQPQIINVDDTLRLRAYDGKYDFAFEWYQDPESMRLLDGEPEIYDWDRLNRMYTYLDEHGELYFIEIKENEEYKPIGDVSFWQNDMPILIGDRSYRGKGIGEKVIRALIERGRQLGYRELFIGDIYYFNIGSQRAFTKCGFEAYERTDKGQKYRLEL